MQHGYETSRDGKFGDRSDNFFGLASVLSGTRTDIRFRPPLASELVERRPIPAEELRDCIL